MLASASLIFAALERTILHNRWQHQAHSTTTIPAPITDASNAPEFNNNRVQTTGTTKRRGLQRVLTLSQRLNIVKRMLQSVRTDGENLIAAKAVARFPHPFRGTENANLARASRLWKLRSDFTDQESNAVLQGKACSITLVSRNSFTHVFSKARSGRGRKREAWVFVFAQGFGGVV